MRDFREFWLIVVVILVGIVGWRVGVAHKHDCLNRGEVGCSILPWSGQIPGSGPSGTGGGATAVEVGSGIHEVGTGASDKTGNAGSILP